MPGVETIAHIRENGRITVLFNAFEGPPRIVRIFGQGLSRIYNINDEGNLYVYYILGTLYEFGTPDYEDLLPPSKRQIGSRSVIMIDVLKVGTVK